MRSALSLTLTSAVFGVLAASANAGQTFTFSNPTSSTYTDSLFETTGLSTPFGSLTNIFTGSVDLIEINYNSSGGGASTPKTLHTNYFLSFDNAAPAENDPLSVSGTPSGGFTVGSGLLSFFDVADTNPTNSSAYLQISFDAGIFNSGGFSAINSASNSVSFSGSEVVLPPVGPGQPRFNFGFSYAENDPTGADRTHYAGSFTSSIGATPQAVPEPSVLAGLALGGLAVLRRRRRA